MYKCAYILNWYAKIRKYQYINENKNIKFYKMGEKMIYTKKENPAAPKGHRVSPQVGVDGFEPPTLCL